MRHQRTELYSRSSLFRFNVSLDDVACNIHRVGHVMACGRPSNSHKNPINRAYLIFFFFANLLLVSVNNA